jgi:hypothetical protein
MFSCLKENRIAFAKIKKRKKEKYEIEIFGNPFTPGGRGLPPKQHPGGQLFGYRTGQLFHYRLQIMSNIADYAT